MTDQVLTLNTTTEAPVVENTTTGVVQEQPAVVAETSVQDVLSFLKDENLRKATSAAKFEGKSVDDLFKAYNNLESLMGKKVTQYTADELAVIKDLQGVPKSADEYAVPEGVDEETGKWYKEIAAKHGLSKNTALEIANEFLTREQSRGEVSQAEMVKTHEANVEALKKEFGSAYEARVQLANRAALELGGEELVKTLIDNGLGANPAVIKMLANVGKMISEDTVPASKQGQKFGVTPEDAKIRIQQLMSDRETLNAYYDRFNVKHELVKAEIQDLYRLAYPE